MADIDPRVAIKALDDLRGSVGWGLIVAWATDKRAGYMQRLVAEGLAAQTRDELAAMIRALNMTLDAPQRLYESFADKLPTDEGEQDG